MISPIMPKNHWPASSVEIEPSVLAASWPMLFVEGGGWAPPGSIYMVTKRKFAVDTIQARGRGAFTDGFKHPQEIQQWLWNLLRKRIFSSKITPPHSAFFVPHVPAPLHVTSARVGAQRPALNI